MPGTFIIQLNNVENQISKLEKIFKYYDKKIKESGLELISHDLDEEISNLKDFKINLQDILQETLKTGEAEGDYVKDVYGNVFEEVKNYKYLEISYGSYVKFNTLRFLGVKGIEKIRYYVSDLEHSFSPTTILLLQNIREIIKDPDLVNIQELLECKREPWSRDQETGEKLWRDMTNPKEEEIRVRYTWTEAIEKFLNPPGVVKKQGQMTDEQQEKIYNKLNKNISLTKEELISKNREIQKEKNSLLEKAKKDKDRAIDPVESVDELLDRAGRSLANSADAAVKTAIKTVVSAFDKYSIGCMIKEALNCLVPPNLNCVDLFRDLSAVEIFSRLSLVFPRGSSTFKQIEKSIEENLFSNVAELEKEILVLKQSLKDLEDAINELEEKKKDFPNRDLQFEINTGNRNAENYRSQISSKEEELEAERIKLFKDLQFSQRQERVARQEGNLAALFLIPTSEEERIGSKAITDKIINAIDTIVPIEDVCEAITNSISLAGGSFPFAEFEGFSKPSIPTPRPINDIFSNVSFEINQAFVQGLTQTLIFLIKGVIDQLLNCDNLDALIARALGAELDENTSTIYDNLSALFSQETDLENTVLGPMVDNFVEQSIPYFQNIVDLKVGGEQSQANLSIGANLDPNNLLSSSLATNLTSNSSGVLDFFLSQGIQESTANWDISFDGEKFEISNGIRILDLEELDKFVKNLSDGALEFFSEIGMNDISAATIADLLTLRNGDSSEVNLAENSISSPLLDERQESTKQEIKDELSSLLNSCTALLSPTETINLLSGKPSPNSLKVVNELMKIRAPKLSNKIKDNSQIKKMFENFGKFSGLGELRDQLKIIANSPLSKDRNVSRNVCEPFNNVDDFRKSLITKELPAEVANTIIDNINKEKKNTIKAMANSILDAINGKQIKPISDFKKESAQAMLDAINGIEIGPIADEDVDSTEEQQESKSLRDKFDEQADNMLNNSDTFKDILNSTISSFFDPMKISFDRDMKDYLESISKTREIDVEIKRFVEKDGEKIITSEFREKLKDGFVPVKDKDNSNRAILIPAKRGANGKLEAPGEYEFSGNESENFLDGFEKLYKKENKKIIGDSFIQKFNNIRNNFKIINSTNSSLKMSLAGSFSDNNVFELFSNMGSNSQFSIFDTNNDMFNSINDSIVKWQIFYEERNEGTRNFEITDSPQGRIYTSLRGLEKPIITGSISFKEPLISNLEKGKIKNVFPREPFISRFDAFVGLLIGEELSKQELEKFKLFYEDFFQDFVSVVSKHILDTNLLKDIKAGSATKLFSDSKTEQNIKLIQMLEFTREQTENEKLNNIDPHILNFVELEQEFTNLYEQNRKNKDSQPSIAQLRGLEKRESPFGKTSGPILTKILIRICILEFLLRTIFISDRFNYSKFFSELELINELLVSHVLREIEKREQSKEINKSINVLFKQEIQKGTIEQITIQEKNIPNIKLKKLIKIELENLSCKIANLTGKEQRVGLASILKPIIDRIQVIDKPTQNNSRTNYSSLQRSNNAAQNFVFEKSIRFGSLNLDYIADNNINITFPQNNELSLSEFEQFYSRARRQSTNFTLYDCDDVSNGVYATPPKLSLTLKAVVEHHKENQFFGMNPIQERNKKFYVFPIVTKTNENIPQVSTLDSFVEDVESNVQLLKDMILKDERTEILFSYCFPIKEIITMLFIHCLNANSDEKSILLFESTKMMIDDFFERVSSIGVKTKSSKRLKKMRQKQMEEEENLGNPLGPISPIALKFFIRTPIQLMKGLATTVDPNIAIADKIVAATSMAAALMGQKFALPYSLASLALLPFPIFTGPPPIGIAPPLTAYNIAFPIGPIFLALEPLLWDLPWWKNQNSKDSSNKKETSDILGIDSLPEEISEKC